jgi:hypothetical protein
MTILLTALVTLAVTVLAGVALDYIRHVRLKVTYSVKDAVPIELDGKRVGAYLVSLSNACRRVVKDVTCHIQAPPAKLRNGGITASQGLQYSTTDGDQGIQLSIPYLKPGDDLQLTVIAESLIYIPPTPDVAIRSPQDVNVTAIRQEAKPQTFYKGFLIAAFLAAFVGGVVGAFFQNANTMMTPKDVFTFAASVAGLPHLGDLYATSSDITYYNQGDLAYAWAAASSDPSEIHKYRQLLSVALETAPGMQSASRANLYYSLGKIDLLLADNSGAIRDFREALAHSKSTVDGKTKVDLKVREFLAANDVR